MANLDAKSQRILIISLIALIANKGGRVEIPGSRARRLEKKDVRVRKTGKEIVLTLVETNGVVPSKRTDFKDPGVYRVITMVKYFVHISPHKSVVITDKFLSLSKGLDLVLGPIWRGGIFGVTGPKGFRDSVSYRRKLNVLADGRMIDGDLIKKITNWHCT